MWKLGDLQVSLCALKKSLVAHSCFLLSNEYHSHGRDLGELGSWGCGLRCVSCAFTFLCASRHPEMSSSSALLTKALIQWGHPDLKHLRVFSKV